jgi:hypothetical protein
MFYLIGRKKLNKRTSLKTLVKIGLLKSINFGKVLIWELEDAIFYTRVSHTFSSQVFLTRTSKLYIIDQICALKCQMKSNIEWFCSKKVSEDQFWGLSRPLVTLSYRLKSKHVLSLKGNLRKSKSKGEKEKERSKVNKLRFGQ